MLPHSLGIWKVRATPRAGDLMRAEVVDALPAQPDLAGVRR